MTHRRLARVTPADRIAYVVERCRGRSVLHLGCTDHPYLDERLASGDLLHARLDRVARFLCGVDLDAAGLQRMRGMGFKHLFEGDIEELDRLTFNTRFEVVLATEIVEHLVGTYGIRYVVIDLAHAHLYDLLRPTPVWTNERLVVLELPPR